jgi:hypothetical protein
MKMNEILGILIVILGFVMLGYLGYIISNPPKEVK